MRTIKKVYTYQCEACGIEQDVHSGDAIPGYPGAIFPVPTGGNVREATGADLVLRRRYGWRIGSGGSFHLCPEHKDK